jgi:tetratricopeptide (TPR) repeat protein
MLRPWRVVPAGRAVRPAWAMKKCIAPSILPSIRDIEGLDDMRRIVVCAGIAAAVLATACGKQEQDTGPRLPVPECATAPEYDAKAFARLVEAMDRSGDMAEVNRRFAQHRVTLETLLAQRHPQLMSRLKPVLDKAFDESRLRERAACLLTGLSAQREGVAAMDAWSRKPEMRAISTAIWTRKPAPSEEEDAKMTEKRKALLRGIASAMLLQRIQANTDAVAKGEAAALAAVLESVPQAAAPAKPSPIAIESVVDDWLAPALVKVPDGDLADYLNFVEGTFAGDYYVALNSAFDFRAGAWYEQLVEQFDRNNVQTVQPGGTAGKDALVADALRSLREIGTPAAAADALAKLTQAERMAPADAAIKALLAEAAIKTAPPMPAGGEQLRVVIQSPNYEQADRHLAKAIELDPTNADAHVMLGRLRYLQGRDTDAMTAFDKARTLGPEHPLLQIYLGDLSYVRQDYAAASNLYQAALAKPEGHVHVHVTALNHLLVVLRKTGRAADYPRFVNAYLARNPEAWNARLDFADYLLASGGRADAVLPVIEPVPDTWFPARKVPTVAAALIRKSAERLDKDGKPVGDSQRAMQRLLGMTPEPRLLGEAICRSGVAHPFAKTVLATSPAPKVAATALVICAVRVQDGQMVHSIAPQADVVALSGPLPELNRDTPLCFAAATRNVKAFLALAKLQVSPNQRCNDGDPVGARLQRMAFGNDTGIAQMRDALQRFYRKA